MKTIQKICVCLIVSELRVSAASRGTLESTRLHICAVDISLELTWTRPDGTRSLKLRVNANIGLTLRVAIGN
jgi:hypothetical protein